MMKVSVTSLITMPTPQFVTLKVLLCPMVNIVLAPLKFVLFSSNAIMCNMILESAINVLLSWSFSIFLRWLDCHRLRFVWYFCRFFLIFLLVAFHFLRIVRIAIIAFIFYSCCSCYSLVFLPWLSSENISWHVWFCNKNNIL